MLKIVRNRIKDLKHHLNYLEENQKDLVDNKYGGIDSEWQVQFNITKNKLDELNNCLKMYNKTSRLKW